MRPGVIGAQVCSPPAARFFRSQPSGTRRLEAWFAQGQILRSLGTHLAAGLGWRGVALLPGDNYPGRLVPVYRPPQNYTRSGGGTNSYQGGGRLMTRT